MAANKQAFPSAFASKRQGAPSHNHQSSGGSNSTHAANTIMWGQYMPPVPNNSGPSSYGQAPASQASVASVAPSSHVQPSSTYIYQSANANSSQFVQPHAPSQAYAPAVSDSRFSASSAYLPPQQSGSLPKSSVNYHSAAPPAVDSFGSSSGAVISASQSHSSQTASYHKARSKHYQHADQSSNSSPYPDKPLAYNPSGQYSKYPLAADSYVKMHMPSDHGLDAPQPTYSSGSRSHSATYESSQAHQPVADDSGPQTRSKARQQKHAAKKSYPNSSWNAQSREPYAAHYQLDDQLAALSVSSTSLSAESDQFPSNSSHEPHSKPYGKKQGYKNSAAEIHRHQPHPYGHGHHQQHGHHHQHHQHQQHDHHHQHQHAGAPKRGHKATYAAAPPQPAPEVVPVEFDPASERRNRREQDLPQSSSVRPKAAPAKTRGSLPSFGGPTASVSASPYAKTGAAKATSPAPRTHVAVQAPSTSSPKKTGRRAAKVAASEPTATPAFNPDASTSPALVTPIPMRYRPPISPAHMVGTIRFEAMLYSKWNGCYILENILADEEDSECTICMEEFTAGQTIATLPCMCRLHQKCIDDWFFEHEKPNEPRPRCPTHEDAIETAIIAGECYVGFLD